MCSNSNSQRNESMERAMSIDLIRDRIVFHSMGWTLQKSRCRRYGRLETKVVPNLEVVKTLREVNSDWLDSSTRILRRDEGEPLLSIGVRDHFYVPVGDFARSFMVSHLYPKDDEMILVPPYRLRLHWNCLNRENGVKEHVMRDYFGKLSSGLRELELIFTVNSTLSLDQLGNFRLDQLRKLNVRLFRGLPEEEQGPGNFLDFLKLVLAASSGLTHLCFASVGYDGRRPPIIPNIPQHFAELHLPATLLKIDFGDPLGAPRCLEIILAPQNVLPHLHSLRLWAWDSTFESSMLYEIFRKLSNSLQYLCLEGMEWNVDLPRADQSTLIRLPQLPRLRGWRQSSKRWNLVNGTTQLMDKLPSLEYLMLHHCVDTEFMDKWTNASVYASVQKLSLFLVQDRIAEFELQLENGADGDPWDEVVEEEGVEVVPEEERYGDPWKYNYAELVDLPPSTNQFSASPLSLEIALKICTSFPNLTELSLSIHFSVGAGMSTIFGSFPQLSKLELRVSRGAPPTENFWDGLLTGLREERVAQLRQLLKRFLDDPDIGLKGQTIMCLLGARLEEAGIRQMKNLKQLQLAGRVVVNTELSFYLAFLNMPQLEELELVGGFRPSDRIIEFWNALYHDQAERKRLVVHARYIYNHHDDYYS